MWGVTVDNLADPIPIRDSLKAFPQRPTTRVVFDDGMEPDFYRPALVTLKDVTDLMGEPIDSVLTKKLTTPAYRNRMATYMSQLGKLVDIWEVGNEVNGDWGGDSPTVAEKVTAGFDEAKKRRLKTSLTLFYSDYYVGTDREMDAWSRQYLPERVRKGLDHVMVSFYPQTVSGPHPDWPTIYAQLAKTFPRAKLAFGELGLAQANFQLDRDPVRNATLVERYYRMRDPIPDRFVGGFFYWTFRQDGVPAGTPIWKAIAQAMTDHDR